MQVSLAPADVFEAMQVLHAQYENDLARYQEAMFQHKANEQTWSLAQMYQHLSESTRFFLYQIKCCLEQRKGSTEGDLNENGKKIMAYGTFPPIKIKMPEGWDKSAPQAQPILAYQAIWQQDRQMIQDIYPLVVANDGSYKTPHLIFGMLNAQQWFKVIEMHLRHHLRQQKELESAAQGVQ